MRDWGVTCPRPHVSKAADSVKVSNGPVWRNGSLVKAPRSGLSPPFEQPPASLLGGELGSREQVPRGCTGTGLLELPSNRAWEAQTLGGEGTKNSGQGRQTPSGGAGEEQALREAPGGGSPGSWAGIPDSALFCVSSVLMQSGGHTREQKARCRPLWEGPPFSGLSPVLGLLRKNLISG